jgi:hypothetical protein
MGKKKFIEMEDCGKYTNQYGELVQVYLRDDVDNSLSGKEFPFVDDKGRTYTRQGLFSMGRTCFDLNILPAYGKSEPSRDGEVIAIISTLLALETGLLLWVLL